MPTIYRRDAACVDVKSMKKKTGMSVFTGEIGHLL